MSVIIHGLNMPKSCDVCPFVGTNDDLMSDDYRYLYCGFPYMGQYVTDYEASRHPDCPLVPLPEGHGRLIDADALREDWLENGENEHVYDTNAMLYSIDNSPTIVPAEGGTDECSEN